MKRILLSIAVLALITSCKDEKKEVENTTTTPEVIEEVVEEKKEEIKLPANIVQLNKEAFEGDGITLTKAQIESLDGDKFIFKVFLDAESMDVYKNGDYSLFIQNFPYEDDVVQLEEKFQKAKAASYWVNLKSAKPYKGEYVLFKTFNSKIYGFKKSVIGVMNLKTKADVFRAQYDDTIIVN